MAAVTLVESAVEPSIAELATRVRNENEFVIQAASEALAHAARAGAALNEAFLRIPRGGFNEWVRAECKLNLTTAGHYRRIAYYLPQLNEAGVDAVKEALRFLRREQMTLPWRGGHRDPRTAERREAAKRMRREGATYSEIAEALAVSKGSLQGWLNPEAVRRRQRKRNQAAMALRRQERDNAVKLAGGATWEGYCLLRKAATVLQIAFERESDSEAKRALENTHTYLHKAEDEMYRAVRLTNESKGRKVAA